MMKRASQPRRQRGLSLIELLMATVMVVGGGGAILMSLCYSMRQTAYLAQFQVAMAAAEGKLQELAATSFDTLVSAPAFQAAWTAQGQCAGLGEDTNCNGALDAGEDLNGNGLLDEPLPEARLIIQIRQSTGDALINPVRPTLLDVHVAACWRAWGRVIGEDQNCNGQLEAGEDGSTPLNPAPNGWAESPVMVSTCVARSRS